MIRLNKISVSILPCEQTHNYTDALLRSSTCIINHTRTSSVWIHRIWNLYRNVNDPQRYRIVPNGRTMLSKIHRAAYGILLRSPSTDVKRTANHFPSHRARPKQRIYTLFFCFFPCPASSNDLSPWMNNDRLFRFIVVAAAWRRWPDKRARGYININSKQTTGRSMYHHHAIPDWTGTKLCASEIHNELSSSTSLEWIGREFSWDYAR